MGPANSHGPTAVPIKASSMRTISKGKAFISGLMAASTMENGKTTRWKDSVSLHGPMDADMKEIILMIKKKAKARSSGLMAGSTKGTGKTESNTGLAYTHQRQERRREVNGMKERELLGLTEIVTHLQFNNN